MKVQFEAGNGRHFDGGVNFLMSLDGRLYAECKVPEGASDDYGYLTLKAALLKACDENGGNADDIVFWYDGQEQYLESDAAAECEVYIESVD